MSLFPSLGEIKIDFRDYEKAEDIQIMDKVAYLYGKFEQVGSVDVEMNYKVQQGCLVITVLKANLLPTVKSTGERFKKELLSEVLSVFWCNILMGTLTHFLEVFTTFDETLSIENESYSIELTKL